MLQGPRYLRKQEKQGENVRKHELQPAGEIVLDVQYFNFVDAASGVSGSSALPPPRPPTSACLHRHACAFGHHWCRSHVLSLPRGLVTISPGLGN